MKRMSSIGLIGLLAVELLLSCGKDKPYEPLEPELQEDYTENAFGIQFEMVYVKGGEFKMGLTKEQGWEDLPDSVIKKHIRNTKLDSYHIGKYEVTQAQWKAVMGTNPSYFDKGGDYPVEKVSLENAQEFCRRLSEQTGKKYVLPTETMWEYAARGGVHKTATMYAGSDDIGEVAWYDGNSCGLGEDNPDYGTHPVGAKKANALGIYDMSGNVAEWCSDWHAEGYDPIDDHNPQGPAEGAYRVVRGGSCCNAAKSCRVSYRNSVSPDNRSLNLGFRVAVVL